MVDVDGVQLQLIYQWKGARVVCQNVSANGNALEESHGVRMAPYMVSVSIGAVRQGSWIFVIIPRDISNLPGNLCARYAINLVPGCYDNHLINHIPVARNKEHSKFMCLG